jgi:hypothetical protein
MLVSMPSAIAQEMLAARARRISNLRRRIVASVLAAFVLAWGVVAFGGSMGAESTPVASTAPTSTPNPSSSSSSSSSDDGSILSTQQS